ncbi:hypothetical protein H5T51_00495 [Candidatus Bathyarchaeota archaeon]|nr:hypothetical protein [Candidatus Bathyarchaeota archaeon]
MPAMTPSYMYTFFALLVISSILTVTFMDYAGVIRFSSEMRGLKNLTYRVAAKATELIALTEAENSTAETIIQTPASIGGKQYWLRFRNDSSRAWVEGGLGNVPVENSQIKIYLPAGIKASGFHVSGYGVIRLECRVNCGNTEITLSSLGGT